MSYCIVPGPVSIFKFSLSNVQCKISDVQYLFSYVLSHIYHPFSIVCCQLSVFCCELLIICRPVLIFCTPLTNCTLCVVFCQIIKCLIANGYLNIYCPYHCHCHLAEQHAMRFKVYFWAPISGLSFAL